MPYTDPEAFTGAANPNLGPGVWPQKGDLLPRHFQIVGTNPRALVVEDAGGFIDLGGVHVYDPDHLDEVAERLHRLADVMRERSAR